MAVSTVPKTFYIHASANNGKRCGFLRLKSFLNSNGEIEYSMILEKRKSEASRFMNFDNLKRISVEYAERYSLENVKIIDTSNGRMYNVKETKNRT